MATCTGLKGAISIRIKPAALFCAGVVLFGCVGAAPDGSVEGRGVDTAKWWEKLPREEWSAYKRVAANEPWFEVYKIDDGLFALYEPGQFEEVISFLIVGETAALLFDTGLGLAPIEPVVARLTDKPVTVLNSHNHYDHIGGNHEFGRIAGLNVPFALQRQAGAPNSIARDFIEGDWLWKTPPDFDADAYEIKPYVIDTFVGDGDKIDLGGVFLEVLATPGHSPDSICLLDRENRRLFTGDTFYLAPLYAHFKESDVDVYGATAQRLAALIGDLDQLMTSHNVPVADPAYLQAMADGFDAIKNGSAAGVETDGAVEYAFDGFSIIAPK